MNDDEGTEPMPHDLRRKVAEVIEPHTINCYADHGDTMHCIDVAFPVICEWIREFG